jgi:hypothetical protein
MSRIHHECEPDRRIIEQLTENRRLAGMSVQS